VPLRVISLIEELEHLVACRVKADDDLAKQGFLLHRLVLVSASAEDHQEMHPLVAVLVTRDVKINANLR